MRIILTAVDDSLYEAWSKYCNFDFVKVTNKSIFEVPTDAVISPANSFGFMDGGIDALYMKRFGEQIETRLQRIIQEDYDGELLIGQAVLVPTKNKAIPFMIAAPTMRVPSKLPSDTVNPYLAAKAAIRCAIRANEVLSQYKGDPNAREIKTLSFPGLGTGIGDISPEICAHQVATAIMETLVDKPMFPYGWQDAVYRHEQLQQFGD